MTVLAPLWLGLLLPWAGLVVWMLLGRHRAAKVPFIELWRGAVERPRASRQFAPPPVSLVAILAAMLLAILAAAEPVLTKAAGPMRVAVILDRGITMSAKGRRAETLDAARSAGLPAKTQATFATVPASSASSWKELSSAAETCAETSGALNRVVSDALPQNDDAVVVLSDQAVRDDPRVVQISPTHPVANVAIERFAVRENDGSKAQAMVTVRNDSPLAHAELSVDGVKRTIDLPPRGQERNYFVDLSSIASKAQATIIVVDEFDGDNVAYLARQHDTATVEMRGSLAPDVRRVVEAYQSARPARDRSAVIAVVGSSELFKDEQPGIIAPLAASRIETAPTVHAHPVTAHLDPTNWTNLRSAKPQSGEGWTPVILTGSQPLVSIREHPSRQVWIGINSQEWARTTDFVLLWTNALDWVGSSAAESFASEKVGELSPEWKPVDGRERWPGWYQRGDGAIVAANAPPARFPVPPAQHWRSKLAALAASRAGGVDLAPYLAVGAIGCALVAACSWPGGAIRRILTPFSAPRTV